MSDTKISALPAGTALNLTPAAIVPVNDASNTTSRYTIAQLKQQFSTAWYSVKAAPYNAAGDGSTNDLAAIQSAVDACIAAGGGVVYFPTGRYRVSNGTITVANSGTVSVHFVGDGMYASRFVKDTTATGDTLTWNCTSVPTSISGLGITAAGGGNALVDGIVTTLTGGMSAVSIDRVYLAGHRSGCVLRGTDIRLFGCLASSDAQFGYDLDSNVTVTDCETYRNLNCGFVSRDTSGATFPLAMQFIGCRAVEDTVAGLLITTRTNVEVTSFQCQSTTGGPGIGATGGAILITNSSKIAIHGGILSGCARGIQITGVTSEVTIDGTIIDSCSDVSSSSGRGIEINNLSSDIIITDVRISRTYRSGIFNGGAGRVRVRGGTIKDFGQGAVANDNAGVMLFGGTDIFGVDFNSATGKPIAWFPAATGNYSIGRTNTYSGAAGTPDLTNAPRATTGIEQNDVPSANRGDASYTILITDTVTQRWDTTLTANRTVTLPLLATLGQKFHIVRTGLGAFTLTVQDAAAAVIKVIPSATASTVDVEYNGTAWQLARFSNL